MRLSLISLAGPFEEVEQNYPDIVAVDSQGQVTGKVMDFCEY